MIELHPDPMIVGWLLVNLQIVAAYLVLDVLTGIYHFLTDNGWNLPLQVKLFQKHHRENTMKLTWLPMLGGIPVFAFGLYTGNPFVIAIGLFGCFAELPHYFAHNQTDNPVVKALQYTGIFVSPENHAGHHTGIFDQNFCVVSSWNNWWFNYVTSFITRKLFPHHS